MRYTNIYEYRIRQEPEIADQQSFGEYSTRKGAKAAFKRRFANWKELGCRIYVNGNLCSVKGFGGSRFGNPSIYDKISDLYRLEQE